VDGNLFGCGGFSLERCRADNQHDDGARHGVPGEWDAGFGDAAVELAGVCDLEQPGGGRGFDECHGGSDGFVSVNLTPNLGAIPAGCPVYQFAAGVVMDAYEDWERRDGVGCMRMMNEFEAKVLSDLSVLKTQMNGLMGDGNGGRLAELERRMERHEQNWQRAKGFLAASVVFAVLEVAVDAWFRK